LVIPSAGGPLQLDRLGSYLNFSQESVKSDADRTRELGRVGREGAEKGDVVGWGRNTLPLGPTSFNDWELTVTTERLENRCTEPMIFKGASELRPNLRTSWQRQKIYRLLSIPYRFEVLAAVGIHCDDHVYPTTSSPLDVEHVNSILDVRNSLVLRQFPTTSVWLDPTH
jgi:hypothetical protein